MITDTIKATGKLTIDVFDESGKLKDRRAVDNLVVQVGKNHIVSRMASNTDPVMGWMALGTTFAAANVSDTALGAEIGRVALTTASVVTNTITYTATFGAGVATGAITEAGVFNAASAGTMMCRTVFAVVNKAAGDAVQITWAVTVS
jgi:hypothetical protein